MIYLTNLQNDYIIFLKSAKIIHRRLHHIFNSLLKEIQYKCICLSKANAPKPLDTECTQSVQPFNLIEVYFPFLSNNIIIKMNNYKDVTLRG